MYLNRCVFLFVIFPNTCRLSLPRTGRKCFQGVAALSYRRWVRFWPVRCMAEGILTAEVDLDELVRSRMDFDVTGHYSRNDIFKLKVKGQPGIKTI